MNTCKHPAQPPLPEAKDKITPNTLRQAIKTIDVILNDQRLWRNTTLFKQLYSKTLAPILEHPHLLILLPENDRKKLLVFSYVVKEILLDIQVPVSNLYETYQYYMRKAEVIDYTAVKKILKGFVVKTLRNEVINRLEWRILPPYLQVEEAREESPLLKSLKKELESMVLEHRVEAVGMLREEIKRKELETEELTIYKYYSSLFYTILEALGLDINITRIIDNVLFSIYYKGIYTVVKNEVEKIRREILEKLRVNKGKSKLYKSLNTYLDTLIGKLEADIKKRNQYIANTVVESLENIIDLNLGKPDRFIRLLEIYNKVEGYITYPYPLENITNKTRLDNIFFLHLKL